MLRISLLFILFGLLVASAPAGDKKGSTATALDAGDCSILVQVTDRHQKPVPGAHVSLTGSSSAPSASKFRLEEVSDKDGRVRFAGLPKGHLAVSAEAHGKRGTATADTAAMCTSTVGVTIPQ